MQPLQETMQSHPMISSDHTVAMNRTSLLSSTLSFDSIESADVEFDSFHSAQLNMIATAIEKRDWDLVEMLVSKTPEVAQEIAEFKLFGEMTQATILHVICTHRGMPLSVIQKVVRANPDATKIVDTKNNTLPIHVALYRNAPFQVIKTLLTHMGPNSLKVQEKQGNTPLHLAARVSSPVTVLRMVDVAPTVASSRNSNLQVPLHLACSRSDASMDVVTRLLKIYPAAIKARDVNQQLPLHVGCGSGINTTIVESLIQKYPDSLREVDSMNHSPYSLAKGNAGADYNDDPLVQFLRQKLIKNGNILIRKKDQAKFALENGRRRSSI